MEYNPKKVTASGAVTAKPCIFGGFVLGTDGTNDPVVTAYDNASAASGTEVGPTATYDASALGLNGYIAPGDGVICYNGIYVEITCAGSVEVTVFFRPI